MNPPNHQHVCVTTPLRVQNKILQIAKRKLSIISYYFIIKLRNEVYFTLQSQRYSFFVDFTCSFAYLYSFDIYWNLFSLRKLIYGLRKKTFFFCKFLVEFVLPDTATDIQMDCLKFLNKTYIQNRKRITLYFVWFETRMPFMLLYSHISKWSSGFPWFIVLNMQNNKASEFSPESFFL